MPFDAKCLRHIYLRTVSLFFRFSLLKQSVERNFVDGLNSLHYPEPIITQEALYTNISVKLSPVKDLPPPEVNSSSWRHNYDGDVTVFVTTNGWHFVLSLVTVAEIFVHNTAVYAHWRPTARQSVTSDILWVHIVSVAISTVCGIAGM